MVAFFLAGGWSIWVVFLFGAICLVTAIRFAWRTELRHLGVIRAMTWATVFAVVGGVAANLLAVLRYVGEESAAAERTGDLLGGLAEAVTPAVLGFPMLAMAWMFVAVGTRRRGDRDT